MATILRRPLCRRDHGEMELRVRAAHEKREAALEDVTVLTGGYSTPFLLSSAIDSPLDQTGCTIVLACHNLAVDQCLVGHVQSTGCMQQTRGNNETRWCLADEMHVERAAREDAERQLAADKALVENMRADWQRKLQERRKEVCSDTPAVKARHLQMSARLPQYHMQLFTEVTSVIACLLVCHRCKRSRGVRKSRKRRWTTSKWRMSGLRLLQRRRLRD